MEIPQKPPSTQASSSRTAYSYIRVSSGQQRKDGGLERQEADARRWCEANGCQLDDQLDLSCLSADNEVDRTAKGLDAGH